MYIQNKSGGYGAGGNATRPKPQLKKNRTWFFKDYHEAVKFSEDNKICKCKLVKKFDQWSYTHVEDCKCRD